MNVHTDRDDPMRRDMAPIGRATGSPVFEASPIRSGTEPGGIAVPEARLELLPVGPGRFSARLEVDGEGNDDGRH